MDFTRQQELLEGALEIQDAAERASWLDQACAGDPDGRREVEELIALQGQADTFFSESVTAIAVSTEDLKGEAASGPADAVWADEAIGSEIGPFRVLERIGEGGCGAVYLVEQETPVRRRLALKVIKLGMDTRSVIARFQAEQQALALMNHPNIARVIDAGATESGRPYFVMELVSGVRITTFCDENRLSIRQRLRLFIEICHAIQHAHQKGIIHRDIKPSNIIVTMHDGKAVPKVIDFGIAKAIEGRLTDLTLLTPQAHFIGTPAYMSPEQATMGGADVDTRSDVYSLGVLLYELLTGQPPFDQTALMASGLDAMRDTIRERDPLPPSACVHAGSSSDGQQAGRRRRLDAPRLRALLKGELDWITMKALEKDRHRRYGTASELAADLMRYLENEPVLAGPPSRVYRLQKLVLRNRVTFAAGAVVVITLAGSSALSTHLYLKERDARRQAQTAERERRDLELKAQNLDYLRQSAEDRQSFMEATRLFEAGHNDSADALLAQIRVVKPSLEHAGMYRTLGDWNADQARWEAAAHRFSFLHEINQGTVFDTTLDDLRYAAVLVELDRVPEYNRLREALIARYAGTDNPVTAERVVKACLLTPGGGAILQALDRYSEVAEGSLAPGPSDMDRAMAAWRWYSLALMAYRAGDYPRALQLCERSRTLDKGFQSRVASVHFVQAMAHARLDESAAARWELAVGRQLVNSYFPTGHVKATRWEGYWFDWLIARIQMQEAASLVQGMEDGAQPDP